MMSLPEQKVLLFIGFTGHSLCKCPKVLPAVLGNHDAGIGNAEAVQSLQTSPRPWQVWHLHRGRLVVMILVRIRKWSSKERAQGNLPKGAPIPHIAVQRLCPGRAEGSSEILQHLLLCHGAAMFSGIVQVHLHAMINLKI